MHEKEVEVFADDSKKVMKTSQYVFKYNKVSYIYTLFELQSPTYLLYLIFGIKTCTNLTRHVIIYIYELKCC